METVKLRNGSEEFEPLVKVTISTISILIRNEPIVWYELVQKARNNEHKCFGSTGKRLQDLALLGNGGHSMHESIRNIVISSSEGDGLDTRFVNPCII